MSWWSTLLAERRHVPVAEFASAVVTRVGAGAAGNEGGDGPYVSHAAGAAVPSSGASADRVARLTAAIDATFRSSSRKRKPGISNTDYTLLTAWFGCKDGGGLARFERRLVSVLREGTCEPHPYYMGEAERDDTKGLIKKNGDFLVRASNNKNKLVVVMGAVEKGKVRMLNVLVSSPGEGVETWIAGPTLVQSGYRGVVASAVCTECNMNADAALSRHTLHARAP